VGSLLLASLSAPSAHADDGLARLRACTPPTAQFVSLGAAPEVEGPIPITAGMHRLWDLGVTWKDINPAPGQFTWATLDAEVRQAEESGSVPMLVLGMTPSWAAANPGAGDPRWGLGTASPPREVSFWRDYVAAVVDRYGPRIKAYQIWNEANLQTFWAGNPEQMADLTQQAYTVIKQRQPGAIVVAPSIGLRLAGPMRTFTRGFFGALGARGNPIDVLSIHTYPAGDGGTQQRVALITDWQQTLVGAVGASSPVLDLPVWDTEVNFGLAGPGARPGRAFSDAEAANLIRQTYVDSLALGIDATFWYLYTAAPYPLLGVQLWKGAPEATAAWQSVSRAFAPGSPCSVTAPSSDRFAIDAQLQRVPAAPALESAQVNVAGATSVVPLVGGRAGDASWSAAFSGLPGGVTGPRDTVALTATGYLPSSPVYIWRDESFARYVLADGSGAVSATDIPTKGAASLQVNGFTPAGTIRSISVSLQPPLRKSPSQVTALEFVGGDLTAASQRNLRRLTQASVSRDVIVIRVVASSNVIASRRARTVERFLQAEKFPGTIRIKSREGTRERARVRLN